MQHCLDKVQQSEFFVGIIGHYRGWQPEDDEKQRSITEIEYDHAVSLNKIVLMVVLPDDQLTLKPELREPDDAWERQRQFRERIKSDFVVEVESTDPKDIAIAVQTSVFSIMLSITNERKDREKGQPEVPPEIKKEQTEAFETAIELHLIDPEKILSGGQGLDDEALIEQFWQHAELSTEKAVDYYKYAGALAFNNHTQKALEAFTRCVELAPDDPLSWINLGAIQTIRGELKSGKRAFENVLALGNKIQDKTLIASATGNIGTIYRLLGDLELAEDYFQRALKLLAELERTDWIAAQLGNLGTLYYKKGDLVLAEVYHSKALSLDKELGNKEGMAYQFGSLGLIYFSQGELERAEYHYRQALVLSEELGLKVLKATQLGNLGLVYRMLGNLELAKVYICDALTLNKKLGLKEGMANQLGNLGAIFQLKGDLSAACQHWQQALDLFTEIGMQLEITQTKDNMKDAGCNTDE